MNTLSLYPLPPKRRCSADRTMGLPNGTTPVLAMSWRPSRAKSLRLGHKGGAKKGAFTSSDGLWQSSVWHGWHGRPSKWDDMVTWGVVFLWGWRHSAVSSAHWYLIECGVAAEKRHRVPFRGVCFTLSKFVGRLLVSKFVDGLPWHRSECVELYIELQISSKTIESICWSQHRNPPLQKRIFRPP